MADELWVCPFCSDHETYLRADLVNPGLCRYVEDAVARARSLFHRRDDGIKTWIWLGEGPETIYAREGGSFHIYLRRVGQLPEHRYSGAHEAYHRACSLGGLGGEWADEMLAVLFSLEHLRQIGEGQQAELEEARLRKDGERCPPEELFRSKRKDWPQDQLFGRAFLLGEALMSAVGWDHLVSLADHYDSGGRPDLQGWSRVLPEELREKPRMVLPPAAF